MKARWKALIKREISFSLNKKNILNLLYFIWKWLAERKAAVWNTTTGKETTWNATVLNATALNATVWNVTAQSSTVWNATVWKCNCSKLHKNTFLNYPYLTH